MNDLKGIVSVSLTSKCALSFSLSENVPEREVQVRFSPVFLSNQPFLILWKKSTRVSYLASVLPRDKMFDLQ